VSSLHDVKAVAIHHMAFDGKMGIEIVAFHHLLFGVQMVRKILAIHKVTAQKNVY